MTNGINGSGNGHDPDEDKNIVSFPSLAERDRLRREKLDQDAFYQKQYRAQKRRENQMINWDKIPPATRLIYGIILLINVPILLFMPSSDYYILINRLGFVPGVFTGTVEHPAWYSYFSPLTHMVLHGDWLHLGMNMIMGTVFTVFFERVFGPRATIKFFLLCGLAGAAIYFALNPFGVGPVIGASGAISGMFGATLMLMYQMGQLGAMGRKGPWPVVLFWFFFMVFVGFLSGGNLAWQAHAGGYIAGVLLLHAMQKGRFKL